jgi:uncharacterized protein (TIGR02145 family)
MDESKTLVAKFKPVSYNIRAAAEPADGGAVFINNTALPGDAALEVGTEITALARPAEGYAFERWSGAGAEGRTDNPATISVAGDGVTITAHFKQQRSGGGTVTTPGGGGTVPTPRPGVVMPGGGPATPNLGGTFRDSRDGKTYRYVTIGGQVWMAENLNYADASIDGNGAWCYWYDESDCNIYGRLYEWATAMDIDSYYNENTWGGSDIKHRGICPSGWHLPSRREWGDLVVYAGGAGEYGERNGGWAGANLKSTSGWKYYNGYYNEYNTDAYGFSALPNALASTVCIVDGVEYNCGGFADVWWTSTTLSGGRAYCRSMFDYEASVGEADCHSVDENDRNRSIKFSVRCVRD